MLPFEFTIKGPPVSHQTKNKSALRNWKQAVRATAVARVQAGSIPTALPVKVTITYYYEGETPDVDNIVKPMQDALCGVVYIDDAQVHESRSRKRLLRGSYVLEGASETLLIAMGEGYAFLHVRVEEAKEEKELDA
jgi:crossover junction endodeoxyribonuclease RusA